MKTNTIVGVMLIALGIIAFTYHGFTYTTTEKAIDLGPLQVTAEKSHTIPLPPVLGGIAILGGVLLMISGAKKA